MKLNIDNYKSKENSRCYSCKCILTLDNISEMEVFTKTDTAKVCVWCDEISSRQCLKNGVDYEPHILKYYSTTAIESRMRDEGLTVKKLKEKQLMRFADFDRNKYSDNYN